MDITIAEYGEYEVFRANSAIIISGFKDVLVEIARGLEERGALSRNEVATVTDIQYSGQRSREGTTELAKILLKKIDEDKKNFKVIGEVYASINGASGDIKGIFGLY